MRRDRFLRSVRASWVDIAWVVFVGLNLLAMQVSPPWQTVPFLIIWVSLTALYGFRLWKLGSTIVTVGSVTLATGGRLECPSVAVAGCRAGLRRLLIPRRGFSAG
jgi:hypothetical protein